MLLKKFKDEFLELLLQFLWRQWSALGVAGYTEEKDNWVIDPEALILFSATMARFDQRLFDEILDWLIQNERFINIQRLKSIENKEKFSSFNVVKAIAGKIIEEKSGLKWRSLADRKNFKNEPQPLFYLKTGQPLPVIGEKDQTFLKYDFIRNPVKFREMSKAFPQKTVPSLLLQIRGLMGINSRSEILLYLLINHKGTIQEIADNTYYAWRSVQDVLFEMGHSSVIHFPEAKKSRVYYFDPEPWLKLFLDNTNFKIQWIGWPSLFCALEIIWLKLNEPDFLDLSELEQATEIKLLMDNQLIPRFVKSGFGGELGKISGIFGVDYLENWIKSIKGILEYMNHF